MPIVTKSIPLEQPLSMLLVATRASLHTLKLDPEDSFWQEARCNRALTAQGVTQRTGHR